MTIDSIYIDKTGISTANIDGLYLDGEPAATPAGPTNELVTNAYYHSLVGLPSATASSASAVSDRIIAIPFYFPGSATVNRIGLTITTAQASSNVRLIIYADNNGLPGDVILDCGEIDSSSTGDKEITISQALDGRFWVAAHIENGLIGYNTLTSSSEGSKIFLGRAVASNLDNDSAYVYEDRSYGAASAFSLSGYGGSNNAPAIWLRSV